MLNGAFEKAVSLKYEKDGKTPTKETIKSLVEKHVERYEGRVKNAGKRSTPPYVNVEQCRHYLNLWTGMRSKSYDLSTFNPAEISELNDAIQDEKH